jgi:pimeloyl-ACP methyl ester carboxylesterase
VRPHTVQVSALTRWTRDWLDRCVSRNPRVLPYLGTANVARDMDIVRAALGEDTLSYIGFSYGSLLGATYATLFPEHVRALVLDGAVDTDVWINEPLEATREQVAAFERALQRFFVACARRTWCIFGGDDPEQAFDRLVSRLEQQPIPATAPTGGAEVSGDTLLVAAAYAMDSKPLWPVLSGALQQGERGNGALLRGFADLYWDINSRGSYGGLWDRLLVISALDQRAPRRVEPYLRAGRHSYSLFPHFWWSSGYWELPWGLFPVRPKGAFRGPFHVSDTSPTALVVGTTYDPATPYVWAKRLTRDLGNARLLTLVGDGHTAFLNYSSCIRAAVARYVETLALPPEGTECRQDFGATVARRMAALRRSRFADVASALRGFRGALSSGG